MKNIIILGLMAALLFSVSAILSMWLQRPTASAETPETPKVVAKKTASKSKAVEETEPDLPKPAIRPQPLPGTEEIAKLTAQYNEQLTAMRDRESRLDRRQAQLETLMQDIRSERQSLDTVRSQISTELKLLSQKTTELEQLRQSGAKTAAEAKAKVTEYEEIEKKNLDRMATVYDSMPPENAAKILQQMMDAGKLDVAAKLLSQMKERQAAKVLAEFSDPAMAAQLLDKMRTLRRTQPTPTAPAAN